MCRLALPEQECRRILHYFELTLPNIPRQLLDEFAFNFGLDAIADIDPLDIARLLSRYGDSLAVISSNQANDLMDLSDIFSQVQALGIHLSKAAGALLIAKHPKVSVKCDGERIAVVKESRPIVEHYEKLVSSLNEVLHTDSELEHALYRSKASSDKANLTLIVTGLNSRDDFVGPRRLGWVKRIDQFERETDIPHFLRPRFAWIDRFSDQ